MNSGTAPECSTSGPGKVIKDVSGGKQDLSPERSHLKPRMNRLPFTTLLRLAGLVSAALSPAGSPAALAQDTLLPTPTAVGMVRAVVDAPTPGFTRLEIHVTTLNPGFAAHPPHHHPQEELILVKEGAIESSINGRRERVGAGSLLFFASHDVHNLTNVGDRPATYYVINFYTAATASVRDQPAAEWEPVDRLRSCVIDWEKLEPRRTEAGLRRDLIDSPTLTFAHLEVHATTANPGARADKPHRLPQSMLVIVKSGIVKATVDGVAHSAGPGSIVFMASNASQSLRNPGPGPSTYFVFSVSSAATKAMD